jgi:regulator of sigma E protease
MLELLRSLLAIALVFGLVIFIHELGHFLAAKAMGVYAPRFSIGFGPALWSRKWGETEYVLAAIPLGGYVRMASREDESLALIEGGGEHPAPTPAAGSARRARSRWYDPDALAPYGPKPVPEHRWFESKPLPARLLIMIAGVVMNILLGFAIFTGVALVVGEGVVRTRVVGDVRPLPAFPQLTRELQVGDTILAVNGAPLETWNDLLARIDSAPGREIVLRTQRGSVTVPAGPPGSATREQLTYALEPSLPPVIDDVLPGSPAEMAGLRGGDSVIAAGGTPVHTWSELVDRIEASPGRPLPITVVRGGVTQTLTARPDSTRVRDPLTGAEQVVGKLGAQRRAVTERAPIPVGRAVRMGWNETWATAGVVVRAVRDLATGQLSLRRLNGPVAIGRASATAARQGWANVFYLVALVSINVAIFNLLPIPILDGGQIVMNVVETVKGSALSARTREYLLRFGLAAIALLFVIVMYNDITNWVKNLFGL